MSTFKQALGRFLDSMDYVFSSASLITCDEQELHNDKVCPLCGHLMICIKTYENKNGYMCLGCGHIEIIEENKQ